MMSLRKRGKQGQKPVNGDERPDRRAGAEAIQSASNRMPAAPSLSHRRRREIISAYALVLGKCGCSVARESDLPCPKDLIGQAICEEIVENPDIEVRNRLRIAYVLLESFLSAEEWNAIECFKLTSTLAQEMAASGRPEDIVASARILKAIRGERAVGIQEKIWEMKKQRMKQLALLERTAHASFS